MKRKLLLLILSCLGGKLLFAQIERVEPPSWWAGMKNPSLQLLVKGDNFSGVDVSVDYPGVSIENITYPENKNYMFIDLRLAPDVKPGSFDLSFKRNNEKYADYSYVLNAREPGSAERQGFSSADVMYLIMPDRFANGDTANDRVKGMREGPKRTDPFGRHGGDIKGISDHLDYISSMGFTALWLCPVLENDMKKQSYHGYATTDFYRVDRRLGTNEEYRRLSEKAKSMGVKLIMDMIFNHCGRMHWWMDNPPFPDWINNYPDIKITTHRRTVNMDPHASQSDIDGMVNGWFVTAMPDLNQGNPFMANYLIQNSIWWIEYAGLSGIRMDTYPYPEKKMMAEWNRRVLEEYPHFSIVGEEWSMNPAIVSYWQKGQNNFDGYDGMIKSMMDFPLQNAVSEGLLEKEDFNTGLVTIYEMLANDFLYPDPENLVIFPDNHDMPRFFMQMGMNRDLFRMGITLFLTTRGIPQIFYGTEILMTHTEGNDHGHIRKDFPGGWPGDIINAFTGKGMTPEQLEMQDYMRKLLNYRKSKSVLHDGMLTHYAPKGGVYVYFRHNTDDAVMVILNKNKKKSHIDVSRFAETIQNRTRARDIITGKEYNLTKGINVPAMSPLVLELIND